MSSQRTSRQTQVSEAFLCVCRTRGVGVKVLKLSWSKLRCFILFHLIICIFVLCVCTYIQRHTLLKYTVIILVILYSTSCRFSISKVLLITSTYKLSSAVVSLCSFSVSGLERVHRCSTVRWYLCILELTYYLYNILYHYFRWQIRITTVPLHSTTS